MDANVVEHEVELSRAARQQQSAWAVTLMMRESPRGRPWLDEPGRINDSEVDLDLALGEFSRRVSREDVEERIFSIGALTWLADRRAVTALIRGLGDPEWDVRLGAADALSEFAPLPEWAIQPLADRLDDDEECVRVAAAGALSRVPSARSAAALAPRLSDRSRAVRLEVAWGLERLGEHGLFHFGAQPALERILLEDVDPYVAYAGYWALGWIPNPSLPREQFRSTPRGEWVFEVLTGR
jgi:HEAT repeat protein